MAKESNKSGMTQTNITFISQTLGRWGGGRGGTQVHSRSRQQLTAHTEDPARQCLQVDRQREVSTGRTLNTKPPEKLRGTAPAVPRKSQINKSGAQLHPHRSSSLPSSLQRSAKEEQEK